MSRALVITVAALVALGRAALAAQDVSAPRSLEELEARAAAIVAEEHLPGAGLALVTKDDGIVWAGGIGKADLSTSVDVTADTLFRVGSISKCFVALAVLRLVADGKLALDGRLADLAPEIRFANPWERTRPVTVAHLLEHTAGFDDTRPMELIAEREDLPLADVLAIDPRGRVSRWPPGGRYSYSNPGYTILGLLIEKATGRAFEDYIRETLLLPLGMVHADFRHTPVIAAGLARGYVDTTPVAYLAELQRPAGQLHASPAELAHLVELWLGRRIGDGAPLFSSETIAALRTPRTMPPSGLALTYGLADEPEQVNGWIAHGHSGGLTGFSSEARYIPELGVGWVVLLNTSTPGKGLARLSALLARYLTRDATPPSPPTGAALVPADMAPYVGYYEYGNTMQAALSSLDVLLRGRTVFVKNGELWAQDLLEAPFRLVPTGVPGGFRGQDDAVTTVLFTHRDEGDVMLTTNYRVKRSPWPVWGLRGVLLGGLALMASSLLLGLVAAARWLVSPAYRARPRRWRVRVPPLLASLLGFASVALLSRPYEERDLVPIVNTLTVSLFAVTSLFAVASLLALANSIIGIVRRDARRGRHNVHALLVSLGACAIVGWMAHAGWIGIRLWNY